MFSFVLCLHKIASEPILISSLKTNFDSCLNFKFVKLTFCYHQYLILHYHCLHRIVFSFYLFMIFKVVKVCSKFQFYHHLFNRLYLLKIYFLTFQVWMMRFLEIWLKNLNPHSLRTNEWYSIFSLVLKILIFLLQHLGLFSKIIFQLNFHFQKHHYLNLFPKFQML